MGIEYLVVVSEADPVAVRVAERWGTPPSLGDHVDGVPIRTLSPRAGLLRRTVVHVRDDRLDARLPESMRLRRIPLVFPSIHRSERGIESLTVHPLGNPDASADVGGRPGVLVPTDPRRMVDALRRLQDVSLSLGVPASYEATHHGPELGHPAFFVEIGYGERPEPPEPSVRALAKILPELAEDPSDHVALGVGGGHYAPHFSDLVRRRHWAFGHILSRHALERLAPGIPASAYALTPGAEGILFARAQDRELPGWKGAGPQLREGLAPVRGPTR